MKYKYIIWDWNGTLYDDVGISLKAVQEMLASRGMEKITKEQYYNYIDIPISRFYDRVFDMEKETFTELLEEFHALYGAYSEDLEFSGEMKRLLRRLGEEGAVQTIVSGCEVNALKSQLVKYGVSGYISEVSGAENFLADSKFGRAARIFKKLDAGRDECVMIGDCLHEYEIAEKLGINCILVGWGHMSPEALKNTGASFVNNVGELESLL